MKIEGLDRVAIGVKDMDNAIEFFSQALGIEFIEVISSKSVKLKPFPLSLIIILMYPFKLEGASVI